MTVLTRGARGRRSGRRPGWVLLTVLLVLAIVASSALVFTDRVELLKLAVILSLWAAVVAAFVSVIYRRQSDADQAKARDLKLVYDLQLDREISARREYELTLESQLRRELASELRAQTADEVASLRAELAALRSNLEILFDTDLGHRPAIETDRSAVHAYSDWARDSETTGRVSSSRIGVEEDDVDVQAEDARTEESPIIDVPAEQPPEPEWAPHEVDFGATQQLPPVVDEPPAWAPTPEPAATEVTDWQPAPAEGQWIPAGDPGSNWESPEVENRENGSVDEYVGRRRAAEPTMSTPPPESRRGRHSVSSESVDPDRPPAPEEEEPEHQPPTLAAPPAPQRPEAPDEAVVPRHRGSDEDEESGPPPGQSVADLLARLQTGTGAGGRRRRREE